MEAIARVSIRPGRGGPSSVRRGWPWPGPLRRTRDSMRPRRPRRRPSRPPGSNRRRWRDRHRRGRSAGHGRRGRTSSRARAARSSEMITPPKPRSSRRISMIVARERRSVLVVDLAVGGRGDHDHVGSGPDPGSEAGPVLVAAAGDAVGDPRPRSRCCPRTRPSPGKCLTAVATPGGVHPADEGGDLLRHDARIRTVAALELPDRGVDVSQLVGDDVGHRGQIGVDAGPLQLPPPRGRRGWSVRRRSSSACSYADGIRRNPSPRSRWTCPPSWSAASSVWTPDGAAARSTRLLGHPRTALAAPAVVLPSKITLPALDSASASASASLGPRGGDADHEQLPDLLADPPCRPRVPRTRSVRRRGWASHARCGTRRRAGRLGGLARRRATHSRAPAVRLQDRAAVQATSAPTSTSAKTSSPGDRRRVIVGILRS